MIRHLAILKKLSPLKEKRNRKNQSKNKANPQKNNKQQKGLSQLQTRP